MVAEPYRKRWTGDEPVGFDSSALCQTKLSRSAPGRAASLQNWRTVFESLHRRQILEGEADGKPPHCYRGKRPGGRDWVRLPGSLPSSRAHSDSVVRD
jgi:hypothetical protein